MPWKSKENGDKKIICIFIISNSQNFDCLWSFEVRKEEKNNLEEKNLFTYKNVVSMLQSRFVKYIEHFHH